MPRADDHVGGPLHSVGGSLVTDQLPLATEFLTATADPRRIGILSDQLESKKLSSKLVEKLNRKSWAKKRLIATVANSEIELTRSKIRTLHFSNRNKRRVSAIPVSHEFRFTNHGPLITSHSSLVTEFYKMREESSRSIG